MRAIIGVLILSGSNYTERIKSGINTANKLNIILFTDINYKPIEGLYLVEPKKTKIRIKTVRSRHNLINAGVTAEFKQNRITCFK